ncbi:MAG: hypothetical protein HXS47_11470 [Theionarchaea archaeon]|nr:hypothetical protein [Theionarchaea archaeon]
MKNFKKSVTQIITSGFLLSLLFTGTLAVISWDPVIIISNHGDDTTFDDQNPRLAIDTRGNSYIVWEGFDGTDREIYWVKITSQGAVGSPVLISTHSDNETTSDRNPQLLTDSEGTCYVVWEGFDGTDQEIYWAKITSQGDPSPVVKLSTHPDNETYQDQDPHLALDDAGSCYVVWEGFDGSRQKIYWIRIDAQGIPGEVQKLPDYSDSLTHDKNPQIAVNGVGTSFIVWNGFDGQERTIYWTTLTFAGEWGDVHLITAQGVEGDSRNPCIQIDVLDNSYLVWSLYNGSDEDIYWAKIDASGEIVAIKCISEHEESIFDRNPQLSIDPFRASHVVWEGYGDSEKIYWVKISPLGIFESSQIISTHADNTRWGVYNPQVATDASGNSYVVWDGYDGIDEEIYWVKVDSYGDPGTVMKISTHADNTYGYDRNPHLAVNPGGTSFVTWSGFNGTDEEIYFTYTITDPSGPQTPRVELIRPQPHYTATKVTVVATIDDSKTGASPIASAEYFIDKIGANGTGVRMVAADGAFDSATEQVTALINMQSLSTGVHIVYVHGKDLYGNWGPFHSIFLKVYYVSAT